MDGPSILLFGAHGYIGGTIAAFARSQGRIVTEVNRFPFPFWEDEVMWPKELLRTSANTAILAASFEGPVRDCTSPASATLKKKFNALLSELRVQRIIFLSTDAVFNGRVGEYDESYEASADTPYGLSKAAMESVVLDHSNAHVLRMSIVYGMGATKRDWRRERFLRNGSYVYRGATNIYRSPIHVSVLSNAVVRMTTEPDLPAILHLATPRMNYLEFLRKLLLPEYAERINPWVDPLWEIHDTSLCTKHDSLVNRLLA